MPDDLHGLPGEKYSEKPSSLPSPSLQRASHESPVDPSLIWPEAQSPTYSDHKPTPLQGKANSPRQMILIFGFGALLLLAGIGAYTIIASHMNAGKAAIAIPSRATQLATATIEMSTATPTNAATPTSKTIPTATTASSGNYPPPATYAPTATPLHVPTATPTIINKGLYVAANIPPSGVDTGIYLSQGAQVSIQASGFGSFFGFDPASLKNTCDFLPYTDPNGDRYPNKNTALNCGGAGYDATATLPTKPVGALVGRIGTGGAWFGVGDSVDFTATQSGELFLIYNDSTSTGSGYSDNSGGYDTAIHVTSP